MSLLSIQLVEVLDPFNPHNRVQSAQPWVQGAPLSHYFPDLDGDDFVTSHNGRVVPAEERSLTFPNYNDFVVICKTPSGSGGKSILRIAALVALTYFSGGLASGAYGALGGTYVAAAAGTYLTALQVGIVVGGSMLINALLPPASAPKTQQADSSPTYGIDGAKNTATEGVPIPMVYGTYRMAGNVINNSVFNDGNTQWLHMLINAGEGPIAGITDIQINGRPIAEYKDCQVDIRLGERNQSQIGWLAAGTPVPFNIGVELTQDWTIYHTAVAVDQVRVDFTAGQLFRVDDKGNSLQMNVQANLEYKVQGESESQWKPLLGISDVTSFEQGVVYGNVTQYKDDGSGNLVSFEAVYIPTGNEVTVGDQVFSDIAQPDGSTLRTQVGYVQQVQTGTEGNLVISANQRTAVRRSFQSNKLPKARLDIRIKRTDGPFHLTDEHVLDSVFIADINEINTDPVAYVNTALLALRIRLSDQLSGIPTVTFLNGGRKVRYWDETTNAWGYGATANAAWVAFDILSNRRVGGGQPDSRFVMSSWKQWGKHCQANGLEFNGVFDTASNVWDASQSVFRCGHASLVNVGTRYSVAIEGPSDPVMLFSVANILQGSFSETWLPMTDRANEIEVTFNDRDNNFQQTTLRAYDKQALAIGAQPKSTQMTLLGVTKNLQAWNDAMIMLNMNRYIHRSIEFSAPIDAVACSVGDVILVQHDMPQWGFGGRLEAGSSQSVLNLDKQVTFEAGKTYAAVVHFDALRRYTGTVTSIVGSIVFLSGYTGQNNVKRIVIAGGDQPVYADRVMHSDTLGYGYEVNNPSAITVGMPYELWDTDALEQRTLVNPATTTDISTTQITVQSPFPNVPDIYVKWMFGESNKVAKPFRIKSIGGTSDYKRDISAIEYNATVYDPNNALPTPNYSSLTDKVQQVTIDSVDERVQMNGAVAVSKVTVYYSSQQPTYKRSTVKVSRNGGSFITAGQDVGAITVDGALNEVLIFKVIAEDLFGRQAPESTAPTITYTVKGKTTHPDNTATLNASVTDTGIDISWTSPSDEDWLYTTVKQGAAWDTAATLFEGKTTSFTWPFQSTGNYVLRARNVIANGVTSAIDSVLPLNILAPGLPTIVSAVSSLLSTHIQWLSAATTQPIQTYEVRVDVAGTSWANAKVLGTLDGKTLTANLVNPTPGDKVIYIQATDKGGNLSPIATYNITVSDTVNEDGGTTVDQSPPPNVQNLRVSAGIFNVVVQWNEATYTTSGGRQAVNLYAVKLPEISTHQPVFSEATLIASVSEPAFIKDFTSEPGTRWHVWAKFLAKNNQESAQEAGGAHGVIDTTGENIQALLDILRNQIGTSQLQADLAAKIDAITPLQVLIEDITVPGSVAYQIKNEADARMSAVANLNLNLVSSFTNRTNDVLTSVLAYTQNYTYDRTTIDGSISTSIEGLRNEFNILNTEGVLTAAVAYTQRYTYSAATIDSAIEESINTLSASLTNNQTGILANAVNSQFLYSRAQTDQAITGQINTFAATYSIQTADGKTLQQVYAILTSDYLAKADATTAFTQVFNQQIAQYTPPAPLGLDGQPLAQTVATIKSNYLTTATLGTAVTQEVTEQLSTYTPPQPVDDDGKTLAQVSAAVKSDYQTKAGLEGAVTTVVNQQLSSYTPPEPHDNDGRTLAQSVANIQDKFQTKAGLNDAVATEVSSLTASLINTFSAYETQDFKNGQGNFATHNYSVTPQADRIVLTVIGVDPNITIGINGDGLGTNLGISGGTYDKVRMNARVISGTPSWDGGLYYSVVNGHGYDANFGKVATMPAGWLTGEWCVIEWDMSQLSSGGADWLNSTVNTLRIDLDSGFTPVQIQIDWVAVGRYAPPVSDAQIVTMNEARASGDLAQATRTDQLLATINAKVGGVLNSDPSCSNLANWTYTSGAQITPATISDGASGLTCFEVHGTVELQSASIPMSAGHTLRASMFERKRTLVSNNGTSFLRIHCFNGAGALLGYALDPDGNSPPTENYSLATANWTHVTGKIVTPAGTVFVRLVITLNNGAGTDAVTAIQGCQIEDETQLTAAVQTQSTVNASLQQAFSNITQTVQASLSDPTDFVLNGKAEPTATSGFPNATIFAKTDSANGVPTGAPANYVYRSIARDSLAPNATPVTPGETLELEVSVGIPQATNPTGVGIIGQCRNSSGTVIAYMGLTQFQNNANTLSQGWHKVSCTDVVPAGTYDIIPILWINQDGQNPTITTFFALPSVKRQSGTMASVQTSATAAVTASGQANSQWFIKTDVNGHAAGIGGSTTLKNGAYTSDIIVNGDNFAVAGSSGNTTIDGQPVPKVYPFVVHTRDTVENGQLVPAGTYMDAAFIVRLQVLYAKIASLIADQIVTTNLSASYITTGVLDGTKITARGLSITDTAGNIILNAGTGTVGIDYSKYLLNKPDSGDNLCIKPVFDDGVLGHWTGGTSIGTVSGKAWTHYLKCTLRDTVPDNESFAVAAGETIFVAADMEAAGLNNGSITLGICLLNSAGSVVNFIPANGMGVAAGSGWTRQAGSLTVPGGYPRAAVWIQITSFTGGNLRYQNIEPCGITNIYVGRSQQGATVGATWGTNVIGSEAVDGRIAQAQADATLALTGIANAAADNVLTPAEKQNNIIPDWTNISNELAGIRQSATQLNVNADAYNAAVGALVAYLNGLGPKAWNDTSGNSDIDGNLYLNFQNYYTQKAILLNAMFAANKVLANNAQTTANDAATKAQAAKDYIDVAVSDAVLSRGEKPAIVLDYTAFDNDFVPNRDQAIALGVDYFTYSAQRNNLANYLNSIGPYAGAWADPTNDSPIDPTAFKAAWAAAYLAETNLLNAISAAAALRANWTNVTGTGKPSDNASANIHFVATGGVKVTGNTIAKTLSGNGAWDAQAYSVESFAAGAYASAVIAVNGGMMFGLNQDPTTDASYTSIDAAWYVVGDGRLQIYESGTLQGDYGTTAVLGDVLSITYDGYQLRYFYNGVLKKVTTWGYQGTLYFDSSIASPNASLSGITFGPYGNPSAVSPVNKITAANVGVIMDNAVIGSLQVGDAVITSAKIAGSIQSDDYVPGSAGWKLQKSGGGTIEAQNGYFRGNIQATSASIGAITTTSINSEAVTVIRTAVTTGFFVADANKRLLTTVSVDPVGGKILMFFYASTQDGYTLHPPDDEGLNGRPTEFFPVRCAIYRSDGTLVYSTAGSGTFIVEDTPTGPTFYYIQMSVGQGQDFLGGASGSLTLFGAKR